MDYKQKYNKLVEAVKVLQETNPSDEGIQNWVNDSVPELAESEGALTWLKTYIEEEAYYLSMDIRDEEDRIKLKKLQNALAWLEKLKVFAEHGEGSYYFTNSEFTYVGKPYSGVSISHDNGVDLIFDKKPIKHISGEKQSEQKKSVDDLTQQEAMDIAVAKCFEQGGQKLADKLETVFHEGDWVVDEDDNSVHQIKRIIENVTSGEFSYDLVGGGYFPSTKKNYHLWTIQDAKDGDVLAAEDKDKVFLYNGKLDLRGRVCAYCGIYKTYDGLRFTKCAIGNYFTYKEPYPATKEQRDMLFQKMKGARYTFDFEKKELKKIEQKPILDIEIPFGAKDSELQEATYLIPEGFHAEIKGNEVLIKKGKQKPAELHTDEQNLNACLGYIPDEFLRRWLTDIIHVKYDNSSWNREDEKMVGNIRSMIEKYAFSQSAVDVNGELCEEEYIDADNWLKSIKDKVHPKQEWNEEDEKMFNYALDMIEWYSGKNEDKSRLISDWLKSLRPQNRWKPSEEQMADLYTIVCECRPADHQLLQDLYYGLRTLNGE